MPASTDNFFGETYLGANPFGAEASDRLNRLATLDQMFQSWFQQPGQGSQGKNRISAPQQMSYTNIAPDDPGGGGGGGGGGGAPGGCPDPGPPPTNCAYGYYQVNPPNGCPYWTCKPDPGGNTPGGSGPSGPGTNL